MAGGFERRASGRSAELGTEGPVICQALAFPWHDDQHEMLDFSHQFQTNPLNTSLVDGFPFR